jgi:agmatinase
MNGCSERGVDVLPHLLDRGDVTLADDDEHDLRAIEESVADALESGCRPLVLGGDHALSFPVLRAMARAHPDLTIVHFDAHPDLYDSFEGDRLSHACPFARIMEANLAARLVQIGIRTLNPHQRDQAERFGVELHGCEVDMHALSLTGPLYVSFDLDGIDPAFAPGVSHREPGGLSTREAVRLLQALPGPVVGADLVELNPQTDVDGVSAVVCAKLLKELADAMIRTGPA